MESRAEIFNRAHCYYDVPYQSALVDDWRISNYLKKWALATPGHCFIQNQRVNGQVESISYKESYELVCKVSYELANRYSVSQGDKVAVIPANTIHSVAIILAILQLDATVVILNANEPEQNVKNQAQFTGCKAIITDHSHFSGIDAIEANKLIADSFMNVLVKLPLIHQTVLESPSILMFTTGTTSAAKAVMQSSYNIAVNCKALVRHHQLNTNSRLLCILPIYYANGLEFTIFSTLMAGSSVVLCEAFDPFSYFKILTENQVTLASLVPSVLNNLLEGKSKVSLGEQFTYFVTAAAPLSVQTATAAYERWGKRIIQGYGLTETTNFSLTLPIDLDENCYRKLMIETDIPSVGSELFGNQVAVIDREGKVVPDGEVGEVVMRGHNVMMGYYNNAEANEAAFQQGWFHSGDLGKYTVDTNGNRYLVLTGRLKNIIKSGGHLISLEDIDRILLNHPRISDAVTCSIPDERLGEALLAIISTEGTLEEDEVLSYLTEHLAKMKIPKRIVMTPEIPKSKNGKVNRHQLAELFL